MCILGLSVFWCMISLLAISRLEKRLPSELQEQLEFHATFSGLWPRTQPGTLGTARLHATCASCDTLIAIIRCMHRSIPRASHCSSQWVHQLLRVAACKLRCADGL